MLVSWKATPVRSASFFRSCVAIAENANADQTYDRSHVIAVVVELIKGLVLHPCAALRHVHRRALHQLLQQLQRDVESLLRIGERHQHRVVSFAALDHGAQCFDPLRQLLPALLQGKSRVVGDIVRATHKGVNRADGVAFMAGQNQEAVVEILGGGACDMATNAVRCPQL